MKIAILHASAGHGHRKIAEAVREGFLASGVPENEILLWDALDQTPFWFAQLYRGSYFYSVKHLPQLWGAMYESSDHPVLYHGGGKFVRRLVNGWIGKKLIRRMIEAKPSAVVSTHFLAPEVLGWAKEEGWISSYLVTVVTDFLGHSFWVNPGTDHYWIMGEEGKRDLEKRGVPSEKITAGGIPVSPRFMAQGKKKEYRLKEGLDLDLFTLLITSGSFGLGPTAEVLDSLKEWGSEIQVIIVCGENQTQYQSLKAKNFPFKTKLYGYVSHMHELMEASDLIIAKPGGSTASEALAKGIPMAILAPIPGQEARNTGVLKERNAAFFLGKPSDIRVILKAIKDYPQVLDEKRRLLRQFGKPEASLALARFVLEKIK